MSFSFIESHKLKHQQGFTMIEILVALLILSIGLLGVASLQVQGLKNNQSAYLKSQATLLAYDMADRMRLNATRAILGDYDGFDTSGQVPTNPNCSTTNNGCTLANQSATDMFEWAQRVNGNASTLILLPDAQGQIIRGAGNLFTIQVTWKESQYDNSSNVNSMTDQTFSVNFGI